MKNIRWKNQKCIVKKGIKDVENPIFNFLNDKQN